MPIFINYIQDKY